MNSFYIMKKTFHCYYNTHARREKGDDGHFIRSSLKICEPLTVSFIKNIDILILLKSAQSIHFLKDNMLGKMNLNQ